MTRRTRTIVDTMPSQYIRDPLPPAITRPRHPVEAVRAQSLLETGNDGRAALAWTWALTGTRPSPITLTIAPGRPPARTEILAEADADPEGSTASPGVPTDYCDQIGDARRILTWLTGTSDDIPLDDGHRGHFIGARDDYARTDDEIRYVRDQAARNLAAFDISDLMDLADAARSWRWSPAWQHAAWQRGVRDLLDWVLGDRPAAPLCHRISGSVPLVRDLAYEDLVASDVAAQCRPVGWSAWPGGSQPAQYGEAIRATISWLHGESIRSPATTRTTDDERREHRL